MTDTPTPGAIAYAAWWRSRWPIDSPPYYTPYADLTPADQRAWEAAAQAVLTEALAQRVWERQAPSSRWQVVPPAGAPPDEPTPATS